VLLSGVFGAIITLGGQGIIAGGEDQFSRLLFNTKKKMVGRVLTASWRTQDPGEFLVPTMGPLHVYLRLKVTNRGRTFAKNVNVCMTEIVSDNGLPFVGEVLDLGGGQ